MIAACLGGLAEPFQTARLPVLGPAGHHARPETRGRSGRQVRGGGPHRLRDAVESAVATGEEYGSPSAAALGVTVFRTEQAVRLGNPNGPRWSLPS
ncbi:hypothetical protein [Streptomyces sp. MBT53]|uniref:hypothetical protein n=1 Tax=Streptomyces sp. MBT53 TaxID=1488384 RepID=UPI00191269EF|nr:hypothetical protein [Streptomyces sp. MBT53]MBK6017090.1 hypothetical protein [Streptomyces sp. MBT53]